MKTEFLKCETLDLMGKTLVDFIVDNEIEAENIVSISFGKYAGIYELMIVYKENE